MPIWAFHEFSTLPSIIEHHSPILPPFFLLFLASSPSLPLLETHSITAIQSVYAPLSHGSCLAWSPPGTAGLGSTRTYNICYFLVCLIPSVFWPLISARTFIFFIFPSPFPPLLTFPGHYWANSALRFAPRMPLGPPRLQPFYIKRCSSISYLSPLVNLVGHL